MVAHILQHGVRHSLERRRVSRQSKLYSLKLADACTYGKSRVICTAFVHLDWPIVGKGSAVKRTQHPI